MHFYHPEFLYGLAAMLIPLVIHLFNFKRFKKVYFSNVSYLKEIHQQSKRHSQWRHILIMILRMIIIASVVIAFAQPYLIDKMSKEDTHGEEAYVSIFVDNSFSMQARGLQGSLFDEARLLARKIALSYSISNHFRLLTNEGATFSYEFVNREVFFEQLENLKVGNASLPFAHFPNLLNDFAPEQNRKEQLFVISDFQKSQANIKSWAKDTAIEFHLIPLKAADQGNVFVDSVWFESPLLQSGHPIKVWADIQNQSDKRLEDIPISLKIMGKKKNVATVSIDAFGHKKISFIFEMGKEGFYAASINVQDYPVVYDDVFYFAFHLQQHTPVLCISSEHSNDDIATYLHSDSVFVPKFMSEKSINYSDFRLYKDIILNGLSSFSPGLIIELKNQLRAGASIVIIPSLSNSIRTLNTLYSQLGLPQVKAVDSLKRKMAFIELNSNEFNAIFNLSKHQHKLDDNTDFPYFKELFITPHNSKSDVLIADEANTPILSKTKVYNGRVYCFYTPFENNVSNITTHAIFVPLFFNLLQQQRSTTPPYFYLGTNKECRLSYIAQQGNESIIMKKWNDSLEFIPQYRLQQASLILSFHHSPNRVGAYQLLINNKLKSILSFNYNRKESYLNYLRSKEIKNMIPAKATNIDVLPVDNKGFGLELSQTKDSFPLWKLFIIIALVFLIIELFLLRYSK